MPKGNGRRKPGRPRKKNTPTMSQDDTNLTEVSQSETDSRGVIDTKDFSEVDWGKGGKSLDKAYTLEGLDGDGIKIIEKMRISQFTAAEIERIKSSDEVYLVTKNKERLENGSKDKQVHLCAWLKEVV